MFYRCFQTHYYRHSLVVGIGKVPGTIGTGNVGTICADEVMTQWISHPYLLARERS